MKKRLFILLLFPFIVKSQPVAHAGSDQTIYLTSTNQITLNGSTSTGTGLTYQWTEVSTDYSSGATITNQTSATTTVTGLPQGAFYFELAVRDNIDRVATDTMKVIVDYAPPPSGVLMRSLAKSAFTNQLFINAVNDRTGDTTNTIAGEEVYPITFDDGLGNEVFFDRNRKQDQFLDAQIAKFYSTVEDGYDWNNEGYGRSEMSFGSGYIIDTAKTYCFEWKGYFPQPFDNMASNQTVGAFMQFHGTNDLSPSIGFNLLNGIDGGNSSRGTPGDKAFYCEDTQGNSVGGYFKLGELSDLVNSTHTIRVYMREGAGYSGQDAFVRIEVDGVTKYERTTGQVGSTLQQDYLKVATLYDYGNALVDPTNSTRHRKFSMVTEEWALYDVTNAVAAPTISMSGSQTISENSTTVTAFATPASGETITGYQWIKLSGIGTISSPTSASTGLTGLSGVSVYQCTATQSDGQTVSGQVTITITGGSTGGTSLWPHILNKTFSNL